jgi:YggT family protein
VNVLDTVLYWIGVLLSIYGYVLFARVVMSFVLQLSQYRPSGAMAVAFEFVYTVTDPPLKFLGRFIPPLRLGNVSLDLSFLVLIIGVRILAGVLMQQRVT